LVETATPKLTPTNLKNGIISFFEDYKFNELYLACGFFSNFKFKRKRSTLNRKTYVIHKEIKIFLRN